VAITTKAQLAAALAGAQTVFLDRASAVGTQAAWNTNMQTSGGVGMTNGVGVLAGTSTTQGVVPDDTTPGFPPIKDIGAGNVAYLAEVDFHEWGFGGRIFLHDLLFKAGAYNWNDSGITLASQPSIASRVPGGLAGVGGGATQLWFEVATAFATAAPTITVGYTNQDGVTGQSTVFTVATAAPAVPGRNIQVPLANGDTGIQKIESVSSTGPTAGTFNLLITRPLWQGRVMIAGDYGDRYIHGPDLTGLPIVYGSSALFAMFQPEGGSNTGTASLALKIAEG
jgi:hypothetical protein